MIDKYLDMYNFGIPFLIPGTKNKGGFFKYRPKDHFTISFKFYGFI